MGVFSKYHRFREAGEAANVNNVEEFGQPARSLFTSSKVLSLHKDTDITDEQGNVLYHSRSKFFSLHDKTDIVDQDGNQVAHIERKILTLHERHFITMADGTKLSAGQLMERFLFPPDLQWTEISRLSGGEKRRLYLLRILMEEPNVLLLDEPTNDLDLDTMAVLENFIEDFNGAIIFVSHDRFFTDRMAKKVFVFDEDAQVQIIMGGYSDYKEKADAEAAEKLQQQRQADKAKAAASAPTQKMKPKSKSKGLSFNETKEYAEIEAVIASKESELKVVEMQMAMNGSDYDMLRELTAEQERLSAELDKLMDRWAYLEEKANGQD